MVAHADSTLSDVTDRSGTWLTRLASRMFVLLLFVCCVAGATGFLGGHTSTANASSGGYDLSLSYPGTVRPGLDTFWELRVTHQGGFKGQITIAVTGSYFNLFETQGFYPTPSVTTRDNRYVYMKFTPPQGDTFKLRFDSYLQPYVAPTDLFSNDATVALVHHGSRVASIDYTTIVIP